MTAEAPWVRGRVHLPPRPTSSLVLYRIRDTLVAPMAVHRHSFLVFEATSWMDVRWGRRRWHPPSHRPRTGTGRSTRTESTIYRSPRRNHGYIHVCAIGESASLPCHMWERVGCGDEVSLVAPALSLLRARMAVASRTGGHV